MTTDPIKKQSFQKRQMSSLVHAGPLISHVGILLTTLLIKISSAWKRVCNLNVTIKVKNKSQDSKSSILHS